MTYNYDKTLAAVRYLSETAVNRSRPSAPRPPAPVLSLTDRVRLQAWTDAQRAKRNATVAVDRPGRTQAKEVVRDAWGFWETAA